MNRMSTQFYIYKIHQLYHLCLWTMLQHVKVGHIALSQMIIFIFGLKTPHLIYLGPWYIQRWEWTWTSPRWAFLGCKSTIFGCKEQAGRPSYNFTCESVYTKVPLYITRTR